MKRHLSVLSVLCLAATLTLQAQAQMPVPPPPRPADSGPSLAVTTQFIQDKLNDIGKVTFIASYQDINTGQGGSNTFTQEVSHVVANPSLCRVDFHFKKTRDGNVTQDADVWFSFKEAVDVVVMPMEQNINNVNAESGHPNFVAAPTTPAITALMVRRPHNLVNQFPFTDPSLADRVAKAITHAIELCGGGNKDPF